MLNFEQARTSGGVGRDNPAWLGWPRHLVPDGDLPDLGDSRSLAEGAKVMGKVNAYGLSVSAIVAALVEGKPVDWCECASEVAAALETRFGKASRRITREFMGSDSWCGGVSYELSFESGAILEAHHIGDWHGHELRLAQPGKTL